MSAPIVFAACLLGGNLTDLKRNLQHQAIVRWDELQISMHRMQGKLLVRRTQTHGQQITETTSEVVFKLRDNKWGIIEKTDTTNAKSESVSRLLRGINDTPEPRNKPKQITGRNDRYTFGLEAMKDSPPELRILDFTKHKETAFRQYLFTGAVQPWRVAGTLLKELVQLDGFEVTDVQVTDKGNRRLTFVYTRPSNDAPQLFSGVEKGWMEFTSDWLLVRYEGEQPNGTGGGGGWFEYQGELADGTPRVSRHGWFSHGPNPEQERLEEVITVVEVNQVAVPYIEFTLTHYGLPEPHPQGHESKLSSAQAPSSPPWLPRTLLAIIACGAFAIGIKVWARHR